MPSRRSLSLSILGAALLVATLPAPATLGAGGAKGIAKDVGRLTLREKIGQLVVFSIEGTGLSNADREAIVSRHLGGVILFADNYSNRTQLAGLTAQIQAAARNGNRLEAGALISVDQEGGVVKRFPDMPPDYSAPEMGDENRTGLARSQGKATGQALIDAGVNVNLAPVGDLDLPPSHVMRERSFGSNRYRVARLATAFGKGLQRKGVAAVGKHFPGFGGATINSDNGPAYVERSKATLRKVDAVPFHRMIDEGIKLMMVSHGMYTKDGGNKPASLSHYITTKRLRKEFAFEGVAISDDLGAVAWRFDGNVAKACKATVRAGMDVALIVSGAAVAGACVDSIYKAVRAGKISSKRIDQAVTRVLKLKQWLGIYVPRSG